LLSLNYDQIKSIERDREALFVSRLAARLQADFSEKLAEYGVTPEKTELFTAVKVALAREYGVRYEEDFVLFLDAAMTLGPHFDTDPTHPDVVETLNRKDLLGDEKMDFLDEYMVFGTENQA
jgi:ABC-type uncharacterized transport system involved in gliding motility auxiliary subunit